MAISIPDFTHATLSNLAAVCTDWAADLEALQSGRMTPGQLLAMCLDDAEPEYVAGWHEYVATLSAYPVNGQEAP